MNSFINKLLVIAILNTLLISSVFSQNKIISLEDATAKRSLYPTTLSQLQWMGKSDNFCYIANNGIIFIKANSDKKDTIIKLDDVNYELNKLGEDKLKRFPAITFIKDMGFMFNYKSKLYTYDLITKKIELVSKYDETADNIDIEPNTLSIAFTKGNNLYVISNKVETAVTNDVEKNIINGQSVHRNEFGIEKGTFWSPNGSFLAFYRMDQIMVTDYPLVDIDPTPAEVNLIKYPMAGMTSHHVTLGVFNPLTKKTIFLKTGEPAEQYLTNITWSPDEKYVFIAVLNRDQNYMKLNKYNAATGEFLKTLFEEKSEKYVEPQTPLYFLKTKPDQFIWLSQRDGFNHMYLYDINGKLIKQLTSGNWLVSELIGFDDNDKKIFYKSTATSPLEQHLYSVEIKSGKTSKISSIKGTHSGLLSSSGKYIIDLFNSTTNPGQIDLESSNGKVLQTLNKNENPLKDYNLGETSLFKIKANDGSDLYCRMIKPSNFDPKKKYPAIVYVYGGPHTQLVTESWTAGAGLFLNYLAQKGYVVFTLDNHGSSNRGLNFEQAIFRNLGTIEADDQMKGIEFLKKQNFVDTSKIGVHGWSYGGFMTITMMLKHSNIFKVAVAGGPVIDWKYYEIMYGERYMDTPETNPEGFKNNSLLNFTKELKGKLLIIHGTSDNTVVMQHSLSFLKKCVDDGVQVDFFVYPGHEHNVSGKDRAHLFHKIENYFNDYLK